LVQRRAEAPSYICRWVRLRGAYQAAPPRRVAQKHARTVVPDFSGSPTESRCDAIVPRLLPPETIRQQPRSSRGLRETWGSLLAASSRAVAVIEQQRCCVEDILAAAVSKISSR
jgi:hypothetical protein